VNYKIIIFLYNNTVKKTIMAEKMKRLKLLTLLAIAPLLVSCTQVISNPDIQKLNDRAVQLMNSGDVKGAISRLESINDINPNFAQIHYNLGIAYYKNQEFEKSINSLKRAIELDKNIADAYYTIAVNYQELSMQVTELAANPDKLKQYNDSSEKKLSKDAIQEINKEYLTNAKDYFSQYIEKTKDEAEKEKISMQIESINEELAKPQT
jgi:tetratricopeptide (TPR) repeat protein